MKKQEFQDLIIRAQQSGDKSTEQRITEQALKRHHHWNFAKENMIKLTEYWRQKYTVYLGDTIPFHHKKICIFAHHDANKKIADYVVYWCKSLFEWDCSVIFVSSCEYLSDEEMKKIKPYVSQIIVRANQGYDFGSYYIGFNQSQKYSHFEHLVIMNDSCFGPVHPLRSITPYLPKGNEVLGNSDYAPDLHLQSFFFLFQNNNSTITSLKRFFNELIFTENKYKYEAKFSMFLKLHGYNLKTICPLRSIETIAGFLGMDAFLPFWHITITNFPTPFLKRILFKKRYLTNPLALKNYVNCLENHNAYFEEKDLELIQKINPVLAEIIKEEMF